MRGDVMHGGGRAILARISIEEASGENAGGLNTSSFVSCWQEGPARARGRVGLIQFAERSSRRKVSLNF